MKKLAIISLFLIFVNLVLAQSSATKSTTTKTESSSAATPTKEDVETALKRTFGYDPGITWVVYDVSPSPVPGVADVLVSINKQNPQHIYVYPPAQTAVIGEMIPFGPNPYAPAREKLQAADGPSQGPKNAAITLVEFSDLECPHCKTAQPIVEKLVADFPQVRYVFQQFPLPASMHPWAKKAAEYADCVAQTSPQMFWKYVDTIFQNQGSVAAPIADDKLKEFATTVGLDPQKLSACAAQPQTEARIKKSMDLGQSLDVTQTPTVFLNGRRVLGVPDIPYEQLKNLVQFEIDHAGK